MKHPHPSNIKFKIGFLFLLILSSCLNDIDEVITTEERPGPAILENYDPVMRPVTGSVTVFVVDKSGDPVPAVDVLLGTLSGTTDDFGHCFFNDVALNARGSLVRVEEDGYFEGSRRFFPLEGGMSYVKIELIDKVFADDIDARTGGTVDLAGGASIQFGGNTISKSDGSLYSGTVSIAAAWLDPSDPGTLDRMPGNLQGVNELNQEVSMATFGMMAVELVGSGGEALNIADGKTAVISMPVPAPLLSSAPSEIPLWSYYEPLGIWVVEGRATLQGGEYVGEVSHFSFWNCDAPFPLIEFEAQFVDAQGEPLVNHQINIVTQISYTGSGFTDDEGFVSGLIPANQALVLQVLNICHEVVYSLPIGPFSENVSLGQITVPEGTGVNSTVLTGELLDCDGLPVEEGIVIAEFLGQTAYFYTDGTPFEISLTSCAGLEEVIITGIDLDGLVQSDPIVVDPGVQTDLGQISACDQQLQEYLLLTVDGVTTVYTNATVRADSGINTIDTVQTMIQAYGQAGGTQYYIFFGYNGPQQPGDYSSSNFIEVINDFNNGWAFQGGSFDSFIVTEYGAVGETVAGTFSGTLSRPAGGTSNISGSFNLTR